MHHPGLQRSLAVAFALAACSSPRREPPAHAAPAPVVLAPAISGGVASPSAVASPGAPQSEAGRYARENFDKREVRIPMRDGAKLFTSIYTPKNVSRTYPILMNRTPYSVGPYGADKFKELLGPSDVAMRDGFIVVYQDVRGCYLSEGQFVDVRPHLDVKSGPKDVDESTDGYDTIEWLLANVKNHNGKVGK